MKSAHQRLEEEFARFCGVPNVAVCASGTAALHLALEALRLPLGSQVLCCDFGMVAIPRAVVLAGHVPVFVDCGNDLNIDPDLVDEACSRWDVRAAVVMHAYGRRARLGEVHALAGKYSPLAVVEDLAEAHAVRPNPLSDAACYSLRKNKEIAAEEGGAVAFRNAAHAVLARRLRNMGFSDEHDFLHLPRCHNYRLADTLAGQALASLKGFAANQRRRREAEAWYDRHCPDEWRTPSRESPWVYDVRIPGLTWAAQAEAVGALNDAGIAARQGFKPMHCQDEFRACRRLGGDRATRLSQRSLYLPLAPGEVTEESARLAFHVIRRVLDGGSIA